MISCEGRLANTEQLRRLGFRRSVFDLLKDAELARANDLLYGRLKKLNRKRKLAEGAQSSALTVNLQPISGFFSRSRRARGDNPEPGACEQSEEKKVVVIYGRFYDTGGAFFLI